MAISFFVITLLCFLSNIVASISGFGVSTIMLPLMLYWLPFAQALFFVAILHWFHDLGRLVFFRKGIDWHLFVYLGVPSIITSFVSARLVTPQSSELLSAGLGIIIIFFCGFIFINKKFALTNTPFHNILAGIITGIIAGIFGLYGAIRSIFLVIFNVNKMTLISTTALISILVDTARSLMYYVQGINLPSDLLWGMVVFVPVSWIGVYGGKLIVERISQDKFRMIVAVFLCAVGIKLIVNWMLS